MPAVTFVNSTIHSSQNWGVRMACFADTEPEVCAGWLVASAGSNPRGSQSGWGRRIT